MAASPFSSPPAGQFATEPSLDEFEAIAAKAFRQLPQKFRARLFAGASGVEAWLHQSLADKLPQLIAAAKQAARADMEDGLGCQ